MRWEKKAIDGDETRKLSREYAQDLLVSSILLRRGISEPEDIRYFLKDDEELLHNPFLFVEMEEAVDRINAAVEGGETIYVYGDRDVDGITSTALLVSALAEIGGTVEWGVPMGNDSYGLSAGVVDRAAERGATLICTVDCGISSAAEVDRARELGVDTIVVDHHNPRGDLPRAVAVINPKVEDSGYPFEGLSACGIVFKLIWALLFSRTSFYGRSVVLLTAAPLNETFVVEAVKLQNLLEVDRLRENVVPGMMGWEDSRLAAFSDGEEIFVHGRELADGGLAELFKGGLGLPVNDLAPQMQSVLPDLNGKSLLQIREQRSGLRRSGEAAEEIDVFADLFRSYVLRREGFWSESLSHRLDLVALSTLADIMPLRGENRILVRKGLEIMQTFRRDALRELFYRKNLMGKSITAKEIAWQISPAINASGRMGEPDKAVELFLARDAQEIERLAAYIIGLNKKRRKMEEGVWDSSLAKARQFYSENGEKSVMVSGKRIDRGITGLLASRLLGTFKVPAIVVSRMEDRATGSLRSPKGFDINGFFAGFGDIFTDFGGHDCAAGFTMPIDRFPEFEEKIGSIMGKLEPMKIDVEMLIIDAEVPVSYLTPQVWSVVELFAPYGEANPPLHFLTKGMRIESCDLFGRKAAVHLKLLLSGGAFKWPAIVWNGAERWGRDFTLYDRVDVVYQLGKSNYNNIETLQMTIVDMRK